MLCCNTWLHVRTRQPFFIATACNPYLWHGIDEVRAATWVKRVHMIQTHTAVQGVHDVYTLSRIRVQICKKEPCAMRIRCTMSQCEFITWTAPALWNHSSRCARIMLSNDWNPPASDSLWVPNATWVGISLNAQLIHGETPKRTCSTLRNT